MKTGLALVAVVLFACSAQAQTPLRAEIAAVHAGTFPVVRTQPLLAERVPGTWERRILKGCMAFNVFGQAHDATWTIRAINTGEFHEANPLLSWVTNKPKRMIYVKGGYAVATTWGFIRLAENHPRIAAAGACISGALSTTAGAINRRRLQGRR